MVESKKSFVLYADLLSLVEKLPDDTAGKLFKIILQYVNDIEICIDDILLEIAFEPIKNQLKRDLEKYEIIKENKALNGKIGNLNRWYPDLYEKFKRKEITLKEAIEVAKNRKTSLSDNENRKTSLSIAKIAVNDNDNVNDNVNVILLEKETKEKNIKKEFPLEKFSEEETDELTTEFGERKKVAQKKERFRPPSIQEVQEYCNERQNGIQAFKFVNFYQSKGWKVGNQSMKDWKAAVRTWEQKNKENGNHQSTINGNPGSQNNGSKVSGTKEILSGARYTEFT